MPPKEPELNWIELVLGFACNCSCKLCPSGAQGAGDEALSSRDIARWLKRGRERGARGVWFGGGEPTLHPDLGAAVARARALGYRRIRVQTNGLRFAYPEYAERLVQRGVNEVSVPLFAADAGRHDAFTRKAGSFDLLCRGLANLEALGVRLEGDLLMTAQTLDQLVPAVRRFASLGVAGFNAWLVSTHGLDGDAHGEQVPPMAAAAEAVVGAMEAADALGVESATLHTPPCVLPRRMRDRYRHAGQWRLLVVTPGGAEPFMAEASPMEGGVYLDGCARCSWRERCLGLRADYLALHGPDGLDPIT